MKKSKERNVLGKEAEDLNAKLAGLSDDELKTVIGGFIPPYPPSGISPDIGSKNLAGTDDSVGDEPKNILESDGGTKTRG